MTTPGNVEHGSNLKAIQKRNNLSLLGLAQLLAVDESVAHKWIKGERNPSAAAARLIEVFLTIEAVAPDIFKTFLPQVDPTREPGKPGRPKGSKNKG